MMREADNLRDKSKARRRKQAAIRLGEPNTRAYSQEQGDNTNDLRQGWGPGPLRLQCGLRPAEQGTRRISNRGLDFDPCICNVVQTTLAILAQAAPEEQLEGGRAIGEWEGALDLEEAGCSIEVIGVGHAFKGIH